MDGAAQTAGVNDAGEHGQAIRCGLGAGAVADAPGDDPVAQLPLGGIVGQRQSWRSFLTCWSCLALVESASSARSPARTSPSGLP